MCVLYYLCIFLHCPLYCRWVENAPVAERLLEVWPSVVKYVAAVREKRLPDPKNKSFSTLSLLCRDPLFLVRVNVFLTLAKDVSPLLTKFQTDQPMLQFLAHSIRSCLLDLLGRFVKPAVLATLTSPSKLLAFHPENREHHVDSSLIDVGFAADKALKSLKRKKKVSDQDVLALRLDTKECLIKMVEKILEKSPLRFSIVQCLDWLNPNAITNDQDTCVEHLRWFLKIASNTGQVHTNDCDAVIKEFRDFVRVASVVKYNFHEALVLKFHTGQLIVLRACLHGAFRAGTSGPPEVNSCLPPVQTYRSVYMHAGTKHRTKLVPA